MRTLFVAGLAASLLGAPALAETALTGVWDLTTQVQGEARSATLTVTEADDGALSAEFVQIPPDGTEATPSTVADIVVDGDSFSFTRTMNAAQQAIEFEYAGTIDGDTLTATATSGTAGEFEVTGERQ